MLYDRHTCDQEAPAQPSSLIAAEFPWALAVPVNHGTRVHVLASWPWRERKAETSMTLGGARNTAPYPSPLPGLSLRLSLV